MTTAERVAATLDGHREGHSWRCRCPVHGGHSLIVRGGREGRLLIKCWGGCATAAILAVLRSHGLLDGEANAVCPGPVETAHHREVGARDRRRRIANALDLWSECYSAPGTIVDRYWRSRGLTIPVPPAIRMHDMMRHHESGGRRPAMVALVEHAEHGQVGVHMTYVAIDGSMQATVVPCKRSLGPVGGGAVRLAHVDPDRDLIVAEGIETAASVMQTTGLPGWAALSANGIKKLILPPEARTVLICADHDASGVGEHAARRAAERFLSEGRAVRLALPPEPGTDFNDVLLGRAYARNAEVRDVAA